MRNARGFTIVEVLVTATLVAVALLAIAGMMPTAYRTVDWSGEETVAVTLAKQRLEWLRNQPYTSAPLAAGTTTEVLAGDYGGYTRTTTVQDNTPINEMKQVTVTVATPSRRSAEIVTLIAE
jgi:prepilin-type N-terminal cleavage/methylation domain-containing protein